MRSETVPGNITLSNGLKMPSVGLGVYKMKDGREVISSILAALEEGYRLIDTASFYNNEEGVGDAIRQSGIPREEIFVTSKLWIDDMRSDNTRQAFERSLEKLGFDYLDLYLIHWPVPGKYIDAWQTMQELYAEGKVKAIGVSNCLEHHLEEIREEGGVQPMLIQNEFHPRLIQQDLIDHCQNRGIQYQAWSPLMRGKILDNEVLKEIGQKYQKTAAQVILRWAIQKGVCVLPKSVHKERIRENSQIFDFKLSAGDMESINSLENGTRTGAHPDEFMDYFRKKGVIG
ncbi:aldo/keto reductase [Gramella sp. GC03-9]|uniref:Aldo/keto reductase n=1 Tax=Christiangramia oceanisediminis TaxID=2920386 RepID=A0A9X2KYX8_9FLAO|nr:aldo/keto reductase [Gramella oceanisediminis]MCP9200880.1 aldo/keto reductase [Gramella oceanisediminis]